eukprot:COSAG06_NODE_2034_length_7781_cov_9.499089_6_plen_67_part_00
MKSRMFLRAFRTKLPKLPRQSKDSNSKRNTFDSFLYAFYIRSGRDDNKVSLCRTRCVGLIIQCSID